MEPGLLGVLAVPAAWTTFFSLFNDLRVRRLRSFGGVGCYAAGIWLALAHGLRGAAQAWVIAALAGGALYVLYETLAWLRGPKPGSPPSPKHFLNALSF